MFEDQYERIKLIYNTRNSEVCLVRHRSLKEFRILKTIRKQKGNNEDFLPERQLRSEAAILKDLRHSGIPILYDYAENDAEICVIEEYVKGISLKEYFEEHKNITGREGIGMLIQVCRILEYLHGIRPFPVLYQDLKPEHVILSGNTVKLIDYGISARKPPESDEKGSGSDSLRGCMREKRSDAFEGLGYGTPGYAAPEILNGGYTLDERSDIYSLGVLAEFIVSHCSVRKKAYADMLIRQALSYDPNDRPSSVSEWRDKWEKILGEANGSKKGSHQISEIAVAGNSHGAGTTHIACSITAALNYLGYPAYYVDRSGEGVLENLLYYNREFEEHSGIIYHDSFRAYKESGPCVQSCNPPDGIRIVDTGTDFSETLSADRIIYVVGSRAFQQQAVSLEYARLEGCCILVNPGSRWTGRKLAKELGVNAYGFPLDCDPFSISRDKNRLFQKIFFNC